MPGAPFVLPVLHSRSRFNLSSIDFSRSLSRVSFLPYSFSSRFSLILVSFSAAAFRHRRPLSFCSSHPPYFARPFIRSLSSLFYSTKIFPPLVYFFIVPAFLSILTVFLPFVLRSSSTHTRDKISSVGVVARLEALSIRTPMRREERNGRYNSPPLFPRRTSLCRIVYLLSPELAPPLTPNLDTLPPMSKREEAPTCIYRFTFTSCVRIAVYDIECSTTLYSFPKHASATHGHIFK